MKFLTIAFFCFFSTTVFSQMRYQADDILNELKKLNSFHMDKYSDYTVLNPGDSHRSKTNILSKSLYFEGLMNLFKIYADDEYYQFAEDWSIYNEWELAGGSNTKNITDYYSGKVYIDLFKLAPEGARIRSIRSSCEMYINSVSQLDYIDESFFFIVAPILSKMSSLSHEKLFADRAIERLNLYKRKETFNKKMNLWGVTNSKKCINNYIRTGENEMILYGMLAIINDLDEQDTRRAPLIKDFHKATSNYRKFTNNPKLLSNENLSNIDKDELISELIWLYILSKGINSGLLKADDYIYYIDNMLNNCILSMITKDGSLRGDLIKSKGNIKLYNEFFSNEEAMSGLILTIGSEIYKSYIMYSNM